VDSTVELGLIGLGPRGLSLLERVCANAADLLPEGRLLRVHVIDPQARAGGRVWRGNQHPELLMNTVAAQISMFVDDSVDCVGPARAGPSLYEWARSLTGSAVPAPEEVRAEAARLGPNSYPSRAFYGRYLQWTLAQVVRAARSTVTVTVHADVAIDLRVDADGNQAVRLAGGGTVSGMGAVVLSQGHLPMRPSTSEASLARFAAAHWLTYLPPGNPADLALDGIKPGEVTVLRGMGLTFFDYMALLTVGRGGRFERRPDGSLRYHASGAEPALVTGSRRGVPYQARGENQKGAFGRHQPLYLTEGVLGRLRARADAGEPADFERELWPLIEREVRAVYYSTLVRSRRGDGAAAEFLREFVALTGGRNVRPTSHPFVQEPLAAEDRLLAAAGITAVDRWDWRTVAHPYEGQQLTGTADFRRWLRAHLDEDVRQAGLGNLHGPHKAAVDVLRDLRNEIRMVVDHGGLSGESYRDELERWYMPLNAYLSIGPPARRVAELGALIDAGVVSVLGPGLTVDTDAATGRFEARLPSTDLRRTADPLVRNLLARGEARLHRIRTRGGGSYPTGGLAVTRRPYQMITLDGSSDPRRFAFGVPTETVHWITAAGIRPGVNSVILTDADAVARAAILAAQRRPAACHPARDTAEATQR
jgi:FAD-NAD(P)-binding